MPEMPEGYLSIYHNPNAGQDSATAVAEPENAAAASDIHFETDPATGETVFKQQDAGTGEVVEVAKVKLGKSGESQEATGPDLPLNPLVERFELVGVAWFPVRMDFALQLKAGLLTRRDADGTIDLLNADVLRSFTAALLQCGLQTSEQDSRPYFDTYRDALAFVVSVENNATVAALFNKLTDLNPSMLPQDDDKKSRLGLA